MSFTMTPALVGLARARASAKYSASASRPPRRASLVVSAGAKGGGGKKSAPPGTNPFASADLMALRGTLPSKPELAPSKPAGGDGEMVRMSEADVVAAFSDKRGGGSMKAARKAAKAGTGKDKTAASKPGAIGSGVGASRGLDPAAQAVLVGVTRRAARRARRSPSSTDSTRAAPTPPRSSSRNSRRCWEREEAWRKTARWRFRAITPPC